MSNIYYSNTVTISKRPKPIPDSIPVNYISQDRINKFQVSNDSHKRFVSETFKAGDRNHKIPTTISPIMMTSGVSPVDRVKESAKIQEKLELFRKKSDYILPN